MMKLYLIDGRYHGTQDEARAHAKELGQKFNAEKATEEVPTDKAGLIAYLNDLQRGVVDYYPPEPEHPPVVKDINEDVHPERRPSYAEETTDLDQRVAAAPLPQRLTWASIALEDARSQIASPLHVPRTWDKAEVEAQERLERPLIEEEDPFA